MEEYYQSKGSNVAIGNFSQFIDFNGDGVIDDKDEETLNPGTSTGETFFKGENEALHVLNSIYVGLRDYITCQNNLDAMRLYNDNVQQITSDCGLVSNAWNTGYKTEACARQFIYILENHEFFIRHEKIYYNGKSPPCFTSIQHGNGMGTNSCHKWL